MPFLLALLLLVPLAAAPALADEPEGEGTPRIYRWVDENGVAHYTTEPDRIPPSLRRRFGVPARPLERTPLEAGAPESAAPEAAVSAPTTRMPEAPIGVAPGEPSAAAPVEPTVMAPGETTRVAPEAPAPARPTAIAPEAWAAQEWTEEPPTPAPASEAAPDATEAVGQELPGVSAGLAADTDRLARVELRIAELSAAIAADEDMLSAWLADPQHADAVALGETPQFREIAARLPKRIQELEALVKERDALAAATP